ncbi:flp-2 [Pristionchus pacificus]|uniref:Flp-2 n=1 Tax=Pristionchus pacificus TaxID=54126 RepID=A0A2A6B2D3_PRIPA|nr:flp-2 [Pristionchus pacificus]|eukprot:PDM60037.1 flp-2 [Pristionchus pacificus]
MISRHVLILILCITIALFAQAQNYNGPQNTEYLIKKRFRAEPVRFGKRAPREPVRFGKRATEHFLHSFKLHQNSDIDY